MKKILFIVLSVLILGGAGFVYFKYYFVFGSGIKTGTLNYVVHKGYVFKTYEGEMILSGVSSKTPGTIQSNQFLFSVDNEEVAKKLERMGGMEVELQYKEYLGALPWRGYSKFIVDSILSVRRPTVPSALLPQ
ncbi:MAG: hypothetical protein IJ338_00985 [Bacteroidaceae bacterium]|nr:hypothetical protein [Bacteroidaceae bacterium]